jgi:hypothetical protein
MFFRLRQLCTKLLLLLNKYLQFVKNPFSIPVQSPRNGNFEHGKNYNDIHGVPFIPIHREVDNWWTVDTKATEKENHQFQKFFQFFKCVYNFLTDL